MQSTIQTLQHDEEIQAKQLEQVALFRFPLPSKSELRTKHMSVFLTAGRCGVLRFPSSFAPTSIPEPGRCPPTKPNATVGEGLLRRH